MSQIEPCPPTLRPPAMVLAWTLALLLLSGCDQNAEEPKSPIVGAEVPSSPASTILPVPTPALSREDLLRAARQAASAYAAGEEPMGPDPLAGRSFALRIASGCGGPAPVHSDDGRTQGVTRWSWGADNKTIELRLTPADWNNLNLIAQDDATPVWEAVEGFWLPRPWMDSEGCPAVSSDPLAEPAAPTQTLGLAAVFEAGGSRVARRDGRAYVSTLRPKSDAPVSPPEDGFRLVLEGRLVSFSNGRTIRCHASDPDQWPVCIAAAKLHRVAFENPKGGEVISEWRPG